MTIAVDCGRKLQNEQLHEKTNNLHMRKQRRKADHSFVFTTQYNSSYTYIQNFKLLTCFCACIARFVSDLVGTQIVGFLTHRFKSSVDCGYKALNRTKDYVPYSEEMDYVQYPEEMSTKLG